MSNEMLIIAPTKGLTPEENSVRCMAVKGPLFWVLLSNLVLQEDRPFKKKEMGRHWSLNTCYTRVTCKYKSPTDWFFFFILLLCCPFGPVLLLIRMLLLRLRSPSGWFLSFLSFFFVFFYEPEALPDYLRVIWLSSENSNICVSELECKAASCGD